MNKEEKISRFECNFLNYFINKLFNDWSFVYDKKYQ